MLHGGPPFSVAGGRASRAGITPPPEYESEGVPGARPVKSSPNGPSSRAVQRCSLRGQPGTYDVSTFRGRVCVGEAGAVPWLFALAAEPAPRGCGLALERVSRTPAAVWRSSGSHGRPACLSAAGGVRSKAGSLTAGFRSDVPHGPGPASSRTTSATNGRMSVTQARCSLTTAPRGGTGRAPCPRRRTGRQACR